MKDGQPESLAEALLLIEKMKGKLSEKDQKIEKQKQEIQKQQDESKRKFNLRIPFFAVVYWI